MRFEEDIVLKNGLVSVVMPVYNCADCITETVRSLQAQTYENWELVAVDDCSTDNSAEVVKALAAEDGRIRYLRLEQNSGAAVARTMAMENAEGEFIAFLDSDDLWHPEKLEKQITFMKENDYAFTCTSYEHIDENGAPLGKVVKCIPKTSYNRLLLDCPVGNSTVVYSVAKMGKFTVPNIRKRNDYALWLKMLKVEPFVYGLPEVLMSYRIRSNSISRNKFKLVKYQWRVYRELEHLSVLRSAFHVCYWGFIKVFHLK